MDDGSRMCLGLAGCVACLLLMGFLTACETAVVELNDAKLKKQAETDKKAQRLLKLVSQPNRLMTASSVSRTFMIIAFSVIAQEGFFSVVNKKLLEAFGVSEGDKGFVWVCLLSFALIIVCSTFLASTLGVVLPKKLVSSKEENSESFAYGTFFAFNLLLSLFIPLERIAHGFVTLVLRLFGIKNLPERDAVTEEEILMMVDAVNETGEILESQKEMINNIFEFDDIEVKDVMTHRTSILAVSVNSPVSDAVRIATEEGYSRIPVFEESIDNIVGVVFAKDLLKIFFESDDGEKEISDIMRDIMYVPQTNSCGELFEKFTSSKNQIAVVVDEYGGTAGIVTMEDIIESIVGNIQDEYDNEEEEIDEITPNTFDVSGTADFEEVLERIGFEYDGENDYDTIGAFVIDLIGRYPEENERISVNYKNIEFSVISTDDKKIERLRAVKIKT